MMRAERGFTLVELIVVVLIVGILAAFAVPSYMRSVETSKADDALAVAQMVATTNRMFKMDHGTYVSQGNIVTACNSGACSANAPYNVCDLVRCKYLAPQDWDSKPYDVGAGTGNGCLGTSGIGYIACVARKSGSSPGTNTTPYANWKYKIDAAGNIVCEPSCPGTDAPPTPN